MYIAIYYLEFFHLHSEENDTVIVVTVILKVFFRLSFHTHHARIKTEKVVWLRETSGNIL